MAPRERRELTIEPIDMWLDGIKDGFAERFLWIFSGMGVADTEDLRCMKKRHVATMRSDLELEGCPVVTLDRLIDAVNAARRPPRKARPPRRRRPAAKAAAGGPAPARRVYAPPPPPPPPAPARRRPQSAPSRRRPQFCATVCASPPKPTVPAADDKAVPVAPPCVVQRGGKGWEPADEHRRERLGRLVAFEPRKPVEPDLAETRRVPVAPPIVVERGGRGWEAAEPGRREAQDRLLRSPRAQTEAPAPAAAGTFRRRFLFIRPDA